MRYMQYARGKPHTRHVFARMGRNQRSPAAPGSGRQQLGNRWRLKGRERTRKMARRCVLCAALFVVVWSSESELCRQPGENTINFGDAIGVQQPGWTGSKHR